MEDGRVKINTRGIPSRVCAGCGGNTFRTLVKFDDDNTIGWYTLNAYCYGCGSAVTLPTPAGVDDDD